MDVSHELLEYFLEHSFLLNDEELPAPVIDKIKMLNRAEKANLKALLFNEAKRMTVNQNAPQIIMWLENCFLTIEKYSFRFHHVYFSPGNEIPDTIIEFINNSRQSLDLCIFTISHHELAQAIEKAYRRGVSVRLITDDMKQFDKGSQIANLLQCGFPVKTDHSKYLMHHKFGIIDQKLAFTGSFNWTYTATKHNQENLLVTSNFDIVCQYLHEFEKLWQEM